MTIGISTSLESNLVGQDVLVLCDTGEDEPSPFSSFIHGKVTSLRIAPNMRDVEAVVLVHGGGPDNIIISPANELYPLQASSLALEHSDISYCIREAGLPLHRGTIAATVQARLPRICTADVPPKMRVSLVSSRSPLGEVLGDYSGTIGHRHKVEQVDLESSAHVVWIVGEGSLASTWNAVAKTSSREPDAKLRAACLLCSLIATDCEGVCHAALFLNGSYSLEAFPLASGPNDAYASVLLAHAYSYLLEFVKQSSRQQQASSSSAFMETLNFLAETRLSWPIIQDAKKLRDLGKSLAALEIDLDGFMRICCALMLLVQSSSLALAPCIRPDELICTLLGIPGPLEKNDRSVDFVYVLQRGLLCWAAGLEVSKENGDGTIILATPCGRSDSYGSYGELLVTREVLRIARCNRAAGYIDELFRKACEHLKLPSSGATRALEMLKTSRVSLVRDICEAAMDEQVGQDWLDAAKESVDSVRESGIGAHIIIVLREDRDPLKVAEQLWLFSTITATRVNPMMKPFHVDLDEARDRLALQSTDESAILEEISTRIGVPPGGIDIRKGALRIGVGVIGHLLKHEAALREPKLKRERCERALKSCMSRIYTKKAVEKVVMIQSLYRSWYERKESLERVPKGLDCLLGAFCLLRRVSEFSERHSAIVHIQRVWRQKRARMKYAGYIRQLRQIQAAVVIQSFYRKYAAMRIVGELRLGQARQYAVEVIQCCMRRHLARLVLLNKAYELRAERAAIVIQAYWRGLVIRRWWGKVRGGLPWLALIIKAKLMAMNEAQVRLCAWWRGTSTRLIRPGKGKRVFKFLLAARKDIWKEVGRHRAARKIQARWRSYRLVRQLRDLSKASRQIQTAIRTTSWRRWWISVRRSVIRLQRNFRSRAQLAEMQGQLRANEWSVRSINHRVDPIILGRDICVIHAPENAEETLRHAFGSQELNRGCDVHIFGSRCKHVIAVKNGWLWVSGHVVPPPPRLDSLSVKAIACGSQHVLFTCNENELCFAWGSNSMGQCGLPTDAVAFLRTPLAIPLKGADGRVKLIAASGKTSAYVTKQRQTRVHIMGQCVASECSMVGDLGNEVISKIVLSVFEDISHQVLRPCVFALTTSGELFSWGDNSCKQLGRTADESSPGASPAKVKLDLDTPSRIMQVSVAAGASYTLAITDAGDVFVWGTVMRAHSGGPPEAFTFPRPTSVILPVDNTAVVQVAASWGDTWFAVLAPECSVWCCRGLRRRGAFAVIEDADPIEWPIPGYETRAKRALLKSSNSVNGSLVYIGFE